ncbi:uncharacterized protein CLUP02_11927 [Colletotrichum lupini]|uniref:Uncharacterized protein n=1 Tax=Colletotrichum lupini TaxID=145971 RepID=A0A9Q8T172_9PEZI|nr:uncharacterized protein CLUP02_11927 [Colletotrichum lupini]UQC86426.1 hypothetical protein CLUP02_11927 [Colletotrichum lupini]
MLQVGKFQVAVSRKKHRQFRPTQFAARNSNPSCLLCPSRGRDPLCVGAFFGFYCYILQLHITAWCLHRYLPKHDGIVTLLLLLLRIASRNGFRQAFAHMLRRKAPWSTCVICSRSRGCIRHSEPPMCNGELKLEWR